MINNWSVFSRASYTSQVIFSQLHMEKCSMELDLMLRIPEIENTVGKAVMRALKVEEPLKNVF